MADDQKVSIIIEAVDKYSKQLEDVSKKLDKLAKNSIDSASKTNKGFQVMGMNIPYATAAITAAATAMIAFGDAAYKAFADAELATVGMTLALNDAGVNGIDTFMQLSKQIQRTTIYTDEEAQRAIALASSFGYTEQQLKTLIPTLADMASKGTLVTGSSMTMESALRAMQMGAEGSERALRSFGITLSDTQVAALKAASEGERLGMIMDIIKSKTEGAAETLDKTATGGMARLKDAWSEFIEAFGSDIAPAVNALGTALTWLIENFTLAMESIQIIVQSKVAQLITAFGFLWDSIKTGTWDIESFKKQMLSIEEQVYDASKKLYDHTAAVEDNTTATNTAIEASGSKVAAIEKEKTAYQQLQQKIEDQKNAIYDLLLARGLDTVLTDTEKAKLKSLQDELAKSSAAYDAITRSANSAYSAASRANSTGVSRALAGYTGLAPGFSGGYFSGVNAAASAAINAAAGGPSTRGYINLSSRPSVTSHEDFMIAPGGQVLDINPNDTIVGFKGEPPFGGKGTTINITGNNIYGVDADNIADALQKKLGNMISIC
jgi:hypothetical protein